MVQSELTLRSVDLAAPRQTGSRGIVEEILAAAGVRIDGPEPWDIQVRDDRFYDRVLCEGTLGFGESYMDGWWECLALDQLTARLLEHGIKEYRPSSFQASLSMLRLRLVNLQSIRRSRRVADVHYDLGNEFFERMLGPTMTYSCGYWPNAATLDESQDAKHDLICEKIGLKAHHRLLDIGSGWGRLLAHAYERTGCRGRGITVSSQQWKYATDAHRTKPIEFSLVDYRDSSVAAAGPYDRIVSVGMFEHVGLRNHRTFFERASELLADDGLLLLHTIGNRRKSGVDRWIDKYIFPNSATPCVRDLASCIDEFFVLEDWHTFGDDYERTLMAWAQNFESFARSPDFPFDRRFYRMWRYYLYSFAGSFRARNYMQLWQLVLSKKGTRGGYRSVR